MNKKGGLGDFMIMFGPKMLLVIILLGAIMIISVQFYSAKYDVRLYENLFLGKRITNCISDDSIIKIDDFADDKIKECINFDDSEEIYVHGVLSDFDDKKIDDISIGKKQLEISCEYDVQCSDQKYYFLTDDNKEVKLSLLIAVNKIEKNV